MAGKYLSKVNLDSMWVPKQALNHVGEQQRRAEQERIRVKDKVSGSLIDMGIFLKHFHYLLFDV